MQPTDDKTSEGVNFISRATSRSFIVEDILVVYLFVSIQLLQLLSEPLPEEFTSGQ